MLNIAAPSEAGFWAIIIDALSVGLSTHSNGGWPTTVLVHHSPDKP
jgi:hypothetical protein